MEVLRRHLDAIDTEAVPLEGRTSQEFLEWSRARNLMDVQNFRRLLELFNDVLYRHEFRFRDGNRDQYALGDMHIVAEHWAENKKQSDEELTRIPLSAGGTGVISGGESN